MAAAIAGDASIIVTWNRKDLPADALASRGVRVLDPVTNRARQVQRELAQRGQHRGPGVPDLLVAATAEVHGAVVVHYDHDFDIIAAVTDQPVEWIVPPGTVPVAKATPIAAVECVAPARLCWSRAGAPSPSAIERVHVGARHPGRAVRRCPDRRRLRVIAVPPIDWYIYVAAGRIPVRQVVAALRMPLQKTGVVAASTLTAWTCASEDERQWRAHGQPPGAVGP